MKKHIKMQYIPKYHNLIISNIIMLSLIVMMVKLEPKSIIFVLMIIPFVIHGNKEFYSKIINKSIITESIDIDDKSIIFNNYNNKKFEQQLIDKNEIKEVEIILNADEDMSYYKFSKFIISFDIKITLKSNEIININTDKIVQIGNLFCKYNLILELIKLKNLIPNFSYKIQGNSIFVKKDIENFDKTGKRLSSKLFKNYELSNASFQRKFALKLVPILVVLLFISLVFAICFKYVVSN